MADVIIKNLKIPESCAVCPVKQDANWGLYTCPFMEDYAFSKFTKQRSTNCPMRELPEHGPLIDISKTEIVIPASREVRL